MKSMLLAWGILVSTVVCCCCGGLGTAQIQELLAGNVGAIIEESSGVNLEELQQIQQALATPTPAPEEDQAQSADAAGSAEESAAADAAPADSADAQDLAGDILGAIQEHIEEGSDEPFSFGCENPTVPMPDDVEGCVSVGGFTTYSTALSAEEVDQMYDDYFSGQGWKPFPALIQDEVLNAWQGDSPDQLAFLSVEVGAGDGGKNMVTLGTVGTP